MKVLVACEYSGVVREAFRALGHDAWSNDLLPADDDSEFHMQGDCLEVIGTNPGKWDLIIMHPPCTALAVSGNRWYGDGMPKQGERQESVRWTVDLWRQACHVASVGVAMENPVGVLPRMAGLKPSQYIQPWQFGHPETKKTGLWLHNLPNLKGTKNVYHKMMDLPKRERARIHHLPPTADRWKIRSTTFQGIADAMADQWSNASAGIREAVRKATAETGQGEQT